MAVQDEKRLRYAIVELVGEKGTANSIEKGLFKGIKSTSTIDFLWVKTGNSVARSCNLEFYNILSIETYDGDVKTFTFFMADEEEQKKAREAIDNVTAKLKYAIDGEDNELIDVEKFTDVPDNFGSHSSNNKNFNKTANVVGSTGYNPTGLYNKTDYTPYKRRDPEPFPFKRDTKKPTKAALRKMRSKLDMIMKGEYEYKLPEVDSEKVKVEKASA